MGETKRIGKKVWGKEKVIKLLGNMKENRENDNEWKVLMLAKSHCCSEFDHIKSLMTLLIWVHS
jgi:hypothetical protein